MPELLYFDKDFVHLEATSKILLKSLAEEMQAVSKGLEKVEQEHTASENDGAISAGFQKALKNFLDTAEAEGHLSPCALKCADSLSQYFGEDPASCPCEQDNKEVQNSHRYCPSPPNLTEKHLSTAHRTEHIATATVANHHRHSLRSQRETTIEERTMMEHKRRPLSMIKAVSLLFHQNDTRLICPSPPRRGKRSVAKELGSATACFTKWEGFRAWCCSLGSGTLVRHCGSLVPQIP
ncbi:uncharacterized protein LOC114291988 [Camellia sinensis]|uniref:uncharacterized protein LOC114291988 n=1 Tax=Camellia sinensis TaxID=4442 RepID=UPI00103603C2|nr:uncharacterized protein LOC114291988 [Camellia sinensis]XP_028091676.1 uncharacterized protein LOC114291988 [Camellia sinensis]XP_028091677.1 uncharacterized protein LOC114291988 [Camellia sinensis]